MAKLETVVAKAVRGGRADWLHGPLPYNAGSNTLIRAKELRR